MRDKLGSLITLDDERRLQRETFFGQEKKPLPYLLGCMNMVLHGVLSPSLTRHNTLADDVRKFTEKDRFNVVLTNPPFGGTEHDSVTANFRYSSKATSITFLQHIMEKVRRGGRVGMVIDDTVLSKTNERAYLDARKELLENFNLHTVISLPAGVFANAVASGTGPKTNLLFFDRELNEQGDPIGTREIWYYEVETVGFSLTKTQRSITENDLPDCYEKWKTRAISERSWTVSIDEIMGRDYDLSARNPNRNTDFEHRSSEALLKDIAAKEEHILELMTKVQEARRHSTLLTSQLTGSAPLVELGELISQRKESLIITDDELYKRLKVRLHAQGIVARDEVFGRDIKTKKQFPVKENDLLVAEIDAKVGGYGIVGAGLEGAIVSSHYFLYEIDTSRIDLRYLELWLKTPDPLNQLQLYVKGALNYAAIRPHHFPKLKIPLPESIDDQRNIVQRMDGLISIAEQAKSLISETESDLDALLQSVFRELGSSTEDSPKETRLAASKA